jgi:hypothetical protein
MTAEKKNKILNDIHELTEKHDQNHDKNIFEEPKLIKKIYRD